MCAVKAEYGAFLQWIRDWDGVWSLDLWAGRNAQFCRSSTLSPFIGRGEGQGAPPITLQRSSVSKPQVALAGSPYAAQLVLVLDYGKAM